MLPLSTRHQLSYWAATRLERHAWPAHELDPTDVPLPFWLLQFEEALATPYNWQNLRDQMPASLMHQATTDFLKLVAPLLQWGLNQLQHHFSSTTPGLGTKHPLWQPNIGTSLWEGLLLNLLLILNPTLILELNVARLRGQLPGETTQARFAEFTDLLLLPETRIQLFQEYAVLARLVIQSIGQWLESSVELLRRLEQDWPQIIQVFQPVSPGGLVDVQLGMGDPHRNGRSVAVLRFASGWKLVYKPRSLRVEQQFQVLLGWVNTQQVCPTLRCLKILEAKDYGWVEYVQATPCQTLDQVQRFYQRQGAYLAILHLLAATDLHFENLIAVGENPILIDLEALFQPQDHQPWAETAAQQAIAASVLRVGMLPQSIWGNAQVAGVDLSGLGGQAGQRSPDRVPQPVQAGTDLMRLERSFRDLGGGQHQPQLNQVNSPVKVHAPIHVLNYVEDLLQGFTRVYQLLQQQSTQVLEQLIGFCLAENRIILRASRTYALLLRESYHPNLLRDALQREQLFDKLELELTQRPYLNQVLATERQALWQGDIPVFVSQPATVCLSSPDPPLQLPAFFTQPSLHMVQQRLVQLNPDDMVRQEWCIRTTLATLAINDPTCVKPEQGYLQPLTTRAGSVASLEQTALDLAVQIGNRLGQLAYISNTSEIADTHTATWLGVTLTANGQQWSVAPLGTSLYDGLAGVSLFLAYLGEITQQQKFTELAQQAFATLEQQLCLEPSTMLGGFSGWGSTLYTYSHLGHLWQTPELWQRALDYLHTGIALIPEDVHFDLLAGAAGGIGGALSLYSVLPEPCLLEFAHQCAHHLLNCAQPQAVGWGWPNPAGEGQALTGFAHGSAGIAWALLQLAAVTEEPLLQTKFQSAAMAAIAYERQAFDPIHLNWRDFRPTSPHTSLTAGMTAWCHGAAGIGLARLQAFPDCLDPQLPQEIQIAIQTTLRNGFGFNHCLCHGDLGNLEFLYQAAQIWPELQESWLRQVQATLQQMQTQGWRSGLPLQLESPGLMTGLAGIGYGLLRIARPQQLPSVLVLEPPRS